MRISISVTNYDGADLREIARTAGDAGVDTLWVTDHLIQADPHASAAGDITIEDEGAFLDVDTEEEYRRTIVSRFDGGADVRCW